jgi:hypothetical protein
MGVKVLADVWHKKLNNNPHTEQAAFADIWRRRSNSDPDASCTTPAFTDYIREGFGLNDKQLAEFKNELFIVFEASISCHKLGVSPDTTFETPPLLTCTSVPGELDLLKKLLLKEEMEDALEDTINLCGFEHLLPILSLNDAIDGWREMKEKE